MGHNTRSIITIVVTVMFLKSVHCKRKMFSNGKKEKIMSNGFFLKEFYQSTALTALQTCPLSFVRADLKL